MAESSVDPALFDKLSYDIRLYRAGDVIFQRGDVGFEMFFIKRGHVELRLPGRVLAQLESGEVFGEMALVDDSTRSASAIAITDVEIVPVSEKQFMALVREAPSFAIDIMRLLARRLRAETRTS